MDPETTQKFEELNNKIDAIFRSTEKMRKYFLWTLIISVAVIVLPLIGLAVAIPKFIDLYTGAGLGL